MKLILLHCNKCREHFFKALIFNKKKFLVDEEKSKFDIRPPKSLKINLQKHRFVFNNKFNNKSTEYQRVSEKALLYIKFTTPQRHFSRQNFISELELDFKKC